MVIVMLAVMGVVLASNVDQYDPRMIDVGANIDMNGRINRTQTSMHIINDVLYLYGGYDASDAVLNDLWKIDFAGDRKAVHVGGVANEAATSTFTGDKSTATDATLLFPSVRMFHKTATRDGKLLIIGGSAVPQSTALSDVWEFDPIDNTFRLVHEAEFDSTNVGLGIFDTPCAFEREGAAYLFGPPGFGAQDEWTVYKIGSVFETVSIATDAYCCSFFNQCRLLL